ncbi:MAG: hypothetical protein QM644_17610, partial [Mobilitalea sp.]
TVSPAASAEQLRLYQEAKEKLFAGDPAGAGKLFASLRDSELTPEPTATWAGAEAVLGFAVAGNYDYSRTEARRTVSHTQYVEVNDAVVRDSLVPLLQRYDKLQTISSSTLASGLVSNSDLLIALLSGIKNWEQGSQEDSMPFFEAVTQAKITGADDWTDYYQKIARTYLADHVYLSDPVFAAYPPTAEECQQAIEKLEEFLAKLKTQGRARADIRAWQLDLARQAKKLKGEEFRAGQKTEAQPTDGEESVEMAAVIDFPDTLVRHVSEYCATYDFKGARNYLKSQGETPLALGFLDAVSATEQLIKQLTADLQKQPATLPMELRSGVKFASLSADPQGALSATNAAGKTVPVEWKDISPETVIALHRNSVKDLKDDAEITRRHTNAIFYDWLLGNRTRAQNAADRFSKSYPDFKARWQEFISNVP